MRRIVSGSGTGQEALDFDDIFKRHAPFVWRVLGRLGVRREDLPDASQEVFLVVHRRLRDFEQRSSLRTWIYGICARVASVWRRKAYRTREEAQETPPDRGAVATQEVDVDRARARALLTDTLAELDDEKRAVFVLYELEDLSMPEVAEALGCPATTAYSRLHAARKLVRAAFTRHELARRTA